MTDPLEDGSVVEFDYPFVRDTYRSMDADEEGISSSEVPTWRPGVRYENDSQGSTVTHADGMGRCRLTLVATFKPGRYPARAFFTRAWITPDGHTFGKTKLRIATVHAFQRACLGYRFWDELDYVNGSRFELESQELVND